MLLATILFFQEIKYFSVLKIQANLFLIDWLDFFK